MYGPEHKFTILLFGHSLMLQKIKSGSQNYWAFQKFLKLLQILLKRLKNFRQLGSVDFDHSLIFQKTKSGSKNHWASQNITKLLHKLLKRLKNCRQFGTVALGNSLILQKITSKIQIRIKNHWASQNISKVLKKTIEQAEKLSTARLSGLRSLINTSKNHFKEPNQDFKIITEHRKILQNWLKEKYWRGWKIVHISVQWT